MPDVPSDLLPMQLADQGTKVRVRIHRITDSDARPLHLLDKPALEFGPHGFGHKDPRSVGADLSGAEEIRQHGAVHGGCDVAVGEDDERRLAAEFHGDCLHVAGCRRCDFAAGGDLAGEGYLGDGRVGDEGSADGGTVALEDVEDTRRQAGVGVDGGEHGGVKRGVFGWLVDECVAGGKGGSGFPKGSVASHLDLDRIFNQPFRYVHLQGIIPRSNGSTHSQRLLHPVHPRLPFLSLP